MVEGSRWTFITTHAFVLVAVERRPDATLREVAETVGVSERQVLRVLDDLEADGYITRQRVGRQNHYTVNRSRRMRHSAEGAQEIGDLLSMLNR